MNLKKLGVQELNTKEAQDVDGGWWFRLATRGLLRMYPAHLDGQQLAYA